MVGEELGREHTMGGRAGLRVNAGGVQAGMVTRRGA